MLSRIENGGSKVVELTLLRPPIIQTKVPIKGNAPKDNKVISQPMRFVTGTATNTPTATPSERPDSVIPFNSGNSLGLNHSIRIALVAGIVIATPIPNTSLIMTNSMKESVSGVNKWADIRTPATVIDRLEPIFAINSPPGKRATVITIIVAETSKLTALRLISNSSIMTGKSGVGDMKFRPIPTCKSISIA